MGLGFLLTDSQNNGRTDRLLLAIVLLAVHRQNHRRAAGPRGEMGGEDDGHRTLAETAPADHRAEAPPSCLPARGRIAVPRPGRPPRPEPQTEAERIAFWERAAARLAVDRAVAHGALGHARAGPRRRARGPELTLVRRRHDSTSP